MIEVVKREGYSVNGFVFRDYTTLSMEEKKMVLDWRNDDSSRYTSYNQELISLEEHLNFIEGLKIREDRYDWLIIDSDNNPVGTANVTSINRNDDIAELGMGLKPNPDIMGFDPMKACYDLFFKVLEIGKLYCSVDSKNIAALRLNQFFGCIFNEKKEVESNGVISEYLVSKNLTKEQFMSKQGLSFRDYILFIKKNRHN